MEDKEASIREALEDFWEENAIPTDPDTQMTVDGLMGPIESMTAVAVLVTLDEIVGTTLPSSVIQAGGYASKDEFIELLTQSILEEVQEKQ